MSKKKLITNFIIFSISSLITLSFMEILVRVGFEIKGKKRLFQSDKVIGWVPKPNIKYSRNLLSNQKRRYKANYTTDQYGFRFSPILQEKKKKLQNVKKLLIIGDSYTGGLYSSDNEAWFAYLEKNLDLDVFAYGIPGSGTLQQWLAYKRLKNYVEPDIVLIQACDNDIFNDSVEYSYRSITRNQVLRTPYLKDNKIYYRDEFYAKIYRFLLNRSNLFYLLDYCLMVLQINYFDFKVNLPKDELEKAQLNWQNIYSRYIKEIRNDGIEQIWTVNCRSAFDPKIKIKNFQTWLAASKANNILVFENPNDTIYEKFKRDVDVYYIDGGHLSDIGNKIFGESLAKEIISIDILK